MHNKKQHIKEVKLPNGDIYLGTDNKGNHKVKDSGGRTTLYNNEDMVMIYGKAWGRKLNEELEAKDYFEIRELIRQEIASVFFDLYKKKSVWAK